VPEKPRTGNQTDTTPLSLDDAKAPAAAIEDIEPDVEADSDEE
jgi:hypothetical protein